MNRCRRIVLFRLESIVSALLIVAASACGSDDPGGPANSLSLSSTSATFSAEPGGANPATQELSITSATDVNVSGLSAGVTLPTTAPSQWLSATLSGTTTPTSLTLQASTGALSPGTYTGTVTVSGSAVAARTIPVTLNVAAFLGNPDTFGNSGGVSANTFAAFKVAVPTGGVLKSVNAYVFSSASGNLKAGVYADVAGSPGALVASSVSSPIVTGRNEIPLTATLGAGSYWVGYVSDATPGLGYDTGITEAYKTFAHPFASALPTTFPAATNVTMGRLNIYLKVNVP